MVSLSLPSPICLLAGSMGDDLLTLDLVPTHQG